MSKHKTRDVPLAPVPVAAPGQLNADTRAQATQAWAALQAAAQVEAQARANFINAANALAQADAQFRGLIDAARPAHAMGPQDRVDPSREWAIVRAVLAALLLLLAASPASAAMSTVPSIGTAAQPGALRQTACTSSSDVAVALGFWSAGDRGGGMFYCDPSTPAAADDGGTVIAGTGGAGRWRRLVSDAVLNVRWFGARCDAAADDYPAFAAAVAVIEGYGSTAPGGTILVPSVPGGAFCQLSRTLTIRRTTFLKGQGGDNYGYQSRIRFTAYATDGIVFRAYSAADGMRSDYSRVEDVLIQGTANGTCINVTPTAAQLDSLAPGGGSGIVVLSPHVKIRGVLLNSWCQDGISVRSSDTQNANYFIGENNFFYNLGRHGLFLGGGNGQGGFTVNNSCTGTLAGYCIYDRSMYGNAHIAPTSDGAKHSYFCGTSLLNSCTIVGAYQEASDGPGSYSTTATIVGGTHANGWTGAPVAAATEASRGSGLIGGMMKRPAQPPLRVVVRDTSSGFTSFPSFPVTLGVDDTVSYDLTNGNALTVLPIAIAGNKGAQLTFQVLAGTTTARLRLQVLGGGAINGLTNYDLFAGQAVTVRSNGATWVVTGKVQ